MEKHMKTYRAHRALAILYAVMAVLFTALLAFMLFGGASGDGSSFFPLVLLLVFLVAIFSLHWFVAKAAKQRKPWARTASIVIGILALFGFPLGTIIGIYLLVNAIPEWEPPPGEAAVEAS